MEPQSIRSIQMNDTFFPIIDGVVNVVHNYAKLMNEISYACVAAPGQKAPFDDSTLPYKVIRTAALSLPVMDYSLPIFYDPNAVRKMFSEKRINIIHMHSPFMTRFTGLYAAKKMGIPAVATFHSKYYDDILEVSKSRKLAKAVTDWIVGFYNKCDSVWAPSEGTAETLRSYGYRKKILICRNGSDITVPEDPEALEKKAVERFGLHTGRKILLFTGNLYWKKNIKLILDTMRILTGRYPSEYMLVFAGNGGDEVQIKQYASGLHFSDVDVKFLGRIEDRDLLSGVYKAADLFFFPSVYDNAPLVLREAASMGTPGLLTEGSNSADIIQDGINGFTARADAASMAEKISLIFSDPSVLKEAGKNAKLTIPVSWEKIIPEVYEKYAEIIRNYK